MGEGNPLHGWGAIAGLLWTAASPRMAFAYLVGWMVLALVGLLLVGRRP
jgi:hypothetical protein